jgi:hypothetical protein
MFSNIVNIDNIKFKTEDECIEFIKLFMRRDACSVIVHMSDTEQIAGILVKRMSTAFSYMHASMQITAKSMHKTSTFHIYV